MPQQFGEFRASELYCPKCRRAQPVREKLLLVLPTGELYEYLCSVCASSLGQRTVAGPAVAGAVPARHPQRRRVGAQLPLGGPSRRPRGLLR